MFKCVLKTLSDTELVAVSQESTNTNIQVEAIASQLAAKSNSPIFIIEKTSVQIRTILISEIMSELGLRLLEKDKEKVI